MGLVSVSHGHVKLLAFGLTTCQHACRHLFALGLQVVTRLSLLSSHPVVVTFVPGSGLTMLDIEGLRLSCGPERHDLLALEDFAV